MEKREKWLNYQDREVKHKYVASLGRMIHSLELFYLFIFQVGACCGGAVVTQLLFNNRRRVCGASPKVCSVRFTYIELFESLMFFLIFPFNWAEKLLILLIALGYYNVHKLRYDRHVLFVVWLYVYIIPPQKFCFIFLLAVSETPHQCQKVNRAIPQTIPFPSTRIQNLLHLLAHSLGLDRHREDFN